MRGLPLLLGSVVGCLGLAASDSLTTPAAADAATASPAVARVTYGSGETGDRLELRLRAAVQQLRGARERRAGYDRDRFDHWTDADGDCLDTRDEVLRQESRVPASGPACDISTGRWLSYYDHARWTDDDDVDIDHLVPLAEAWDSGARRWNDGTRRRLANDLRDGRALVAVTDDVNQSKGDQDVAEWLPPRRGEHCRYVRQWVAVKVRWSLRVDRPERRALRREAADCRNRVLTVRTARIRTPG